MGTIIFLYLCKSLVLVGADPNAWLTGCSVQEGVSGGITPSAITSSSG
jgi:hypothetical protein